MANIVPDELLQGLVFDCDGTLVDSMPIYWKSWKMTCSKYGLVLTWKRFQELAGVPVKDIIKILIDDLHSENPLDVEQVYADKKRFATQVIEELGTPEIAVVVDIVKRYHGKVPLAVASSGTREHVIFSLKSNGLMEYFDTIVAAEDIKNPKPAPDVFLEACRRINADPRFCRGFEDADLGCESVRRAGMEVVDVRLMDGYPHSCHD